jgi:hypothetical protein
LIVLPETRSTWTTRVDQLGWRDGRAGSYPEMRTRTIRFAGMFVGLVLVGGLFAACNPVKPPPPPPTPGFDGTATWPFNEGSGTVAADSTGNGHTAQLNGATTFVPGAVRVDGLPADVVTVPAPPAPDDLWPTSQLDITATVTVVSETGSASNAVAIAQHFANGTPQPPGSVDYAFGIDGQGDLGFDYDSNQGAGQGFGVVQTGIDDGKPHTVGVHWNASTLSLSIDGTSVGSIVPAGSPPVGGVGSAVALTIGGPHGSGTPSAQDVIDISNLTVATS